MPNWMSFLAYVTISNISPGPNNIISMINGKHYGYKKTLKFMLGIMLGFFLIMNICASFNIFLDALIPKFKVVMGMIGAFYFLYLAYKIIICTNDYKYKNENGLNTFMHGFLLQFVNVKGIIYGINLYGTFIIPYFHNKVVLCLFSLLFALIAFIGTSIWALFGTIFQSFLEQYDLVFRLTVGLILIYCALSVSGLLRIFQNIWFS
ncbi:MAG: LysE family transporter [Firmicutes bacterium]|nr:LysE family transporter [Bacillota bacterium]